MEVIILTQKLKDGLNLKTSLKDVNSVFTSIENFTKKDIINKPELFKSTTIIFSTWNMPVFTLEEVVKYFPSLKAIFYAAGSVKYFANSFLNAGVRIFSAAKINAIPVAEFVTAQILLANKGYFQAQKEYKKPFWKKSFYKARKFLLQKKGNYNAKIGIIGCGNIGSKVVELLMPYDLEVCIYDPYLPDKRVKELGVKRVTLKEIFSKCDVISNHLPNTPETKKIINKKLLFLLKEHATFINTGRGAQVVERDLIELSRKKPNVCILLDVTEREPVWPWSPLLRRRNVFLTPHISGSISNEVKRLSKSMVNAYFDFKAGRFNTLEVSANELSLQA